jgi:hypothetical protein
MARENLTNGGQNTPIYEEEGARDRRVPQEIFETMIPALQIGGLAGMKFNLLPLRKPLSAFQHFIATEGLGTEISITRHNGNYCWRVWRRYSLKDASIIRFSIWNPVVHPWHRILR